jgi:hypothetical protein
VIERFFLPESPARAEQSIQGPSGEFLPRSTLLFKQRHSNQAEKKVDMIGHDHKVAKRVANSVEMS